MWRHKWFKILIALQIANFAAMVLLEQQRRSIWNKEAVNTQRIIDNRFFTEKTEENYRQLANLMGDLKTRMTVVQGAALRDANNAELLRDLQTRITVVPGGAQPDNLNFDATLMGTRADFRKEPITELELKIAGSWDVAFKDW